MRQTGSVSAYTHNRSTFCKELEGNCFEAVSWARTIDLDITEMEWRAVVMKRVMKRAVRQILGLGDLCEASIARPLETVWEVEENLRHPINLQTKNVGAVLDAWNFVTTLQHLGKISTIHGEAKPKYLLRKLPSVMSSIKVNNSCTDLCRCKLKNLPYLLVWVTAGRR